MGGSKPATWPPEPVTSRIATTVWRVNAELIVAIAEHLGEPVDSYVNGSQTWFEDHGPNDVALEWRLHPVGGYLGPSGLSPYELWESIIAALHAGADGRALVLGQETRSLESIWEGLECFPAHGDDLEPGELRGRVSGLLGLEPDAAGLVDHQAIGQAWEEARGEASIVSLLFQQLAT